MKSGPDEYCTMEGAIILSNIIKAYWNVRGYYPNVNVFPLKSGRTHALVYCIRSSLHGHEQP